MALTINSLTVGDELPTRVHEATSVSLFLYNAAVWNPHRIHYDAPYAEQEEGYPALVIDGPLQGDWLCQVVTNWLEDAGTLRSFSYANRGTAYLGELLVSGGRVVKLDAASRRVDVELFVNNEAGEVITPGAATVELFG